MALSAADFQRAFTVDVPVGDIVSKGVNLLQEQEAERERKRLQNIEYFYKQYDPLLVGTGTPDDPYIIKQLQDIEAQAMSLPLKKMSQSQFTSTIRGMLAPVKGRREQAKQFAANIEQEAKALHEQDPTIKEEALVREAKRRAFFDENNNPVESFDYNRNHASTVFNENPLGFVDIDAAGGLFNKETKNKLINQTNVPSQYDPNTKFDLTRTIYQRPVLNKDGSAELETIYQPIKVSKDVTLKALPDEQFNALANSPGGKWLIQNELKKYKQMPGLEKVDNEVLLHAAAYDVANNKVDRSDTQISSKNEPRIAGGRGGGSGAGGGDRFVAQDIDPNNASIGAALSDPYYTKHLKAAQGQFGQQGWLNATTNYPKNRFIIGLKLEKKPNFNTGEVEEKETPEYGSIFINPTSNQAWVVDSKGKSIEKMPLQTAEQQNYFYNKYGNLNGTSALEGYSKREAHSAQSQLATELNNIKSQRQLQQDINRLGQSLQDIVQPQRRIDVNFNPFKFGGF